MEQERTEFEQKMLDQLYEWKQSPRESGKPVADDIACLSLIDDNIYDLGYRTRTSKSAAAQFCLYYGTELLWRIIGDLGNEMREIRHFVLHHPAARVAQRKWFNKCDFEPNGEGARLYVYVWDEDKSSSGGLGKAFGLTATVIRQMAYMAALVEDIGVSLLDREAMGEQLANFSRWTEERLDEARLIKELIVQKARKAKHGARLTEVKTPASSFFTRKGRDDK